MNSSRINRVIENMNSCGVKQLLVTHTPSVYYLTGHHISPGERMLALYINISGDVRLYANQLFAISDKTLPITEFSDTDDCIAVLADGLRPGEIGIDGFWPSRFTIRLMQQRPDITPVLGSAPIENARMIKDEAEIELMRAASRMNDAALKQTIAELHAGMTETGLEAAYIHNAKAQGGTGPSFAPICCFGKNCAEPHHDNDETVLCAGDSVILDVGLLHERYCSDMTRTVFFGHVTDEQRKVYDIVRRANEAGRAAVRPGVPMCEFDRAARKVIEDAGYGKYFIHRTGHGIGLEVHEYPDNSATSRIIARPGMCFSVEPGIYLPGRFGVRIEDLVCVTEDGCETLNALDRELQVII